MSRLRMVLVVLLLGAAFVFLQYRLWSEKNGISEFLRLRKQISAQHLENEKLRKQNDQLALQVQRIQNSTDAVESRARSELGMVKKGETFYQVVK